MTALAKSEDVTENTMFTAKVDGEKIVLTRVGGEVKAFSNKCPHWGLPLNRGSVENGVVKCPFHASTFDVCTGAAKDWCVGFVGVGLPKFAQSVVAMGKDPTALTLIDITEVDGEVRLAN